MCVAIGRTGFGSIHPKCGSMPIFQVASGSRAVTAGQPEMSRAVRQAESGWPVAPYGALRTILHATVRSAFTVLAIGPARRRACSR